MKTFIETLRDGKCTVIATLPASREEAMEAIETLPDAALMELLERAVTHWWHHSAPKKEKGVDKKVAYGSAEEPATLADIMGWASEATRRESGPTEKDTKDADEWFAVRRIIWEKENPEAGATARLAAFQQIVEGRADANRKANYPALQWQWNAEKSALENLAIMQRAFRLYKAAAL